MLIRVWSTVNACSGVVQMHDWFLARQQQHLLCPVHPAVDHFALTSEAVAVGSVLLQLHSQTMNSTCLMGYGQ